MSSVGDLITSLHDQVADLFEDLRAQLGAMEKSLHQQIDTAFVLRVPPPRQEKGPEKTLPQIDRRVAAIFDQRIAEEMRQRISDALNHQKFPPQTEQMLLSTQGSIQEFERLFGKRLNRVQLVAIGILLNHGDSSFVTLTLLQEMSGYAESAMQGAVRSLQKAIDIKHTKAEPFPWIIVGEKKEGWKCLLLEEIQTE